MNIPASTCPLRAASRSKNGRRPVALWLSRTPDYFAAQRRTFGRRRQIRTRTSAVLAACRRGFIRTPPCCKMLTAIFSTRHNRKSQDKTLSLQWFAQVARVWAIDDAESALQVLAELPHIWSARYLQTRVRLQARTSAVVRGVARVEIAASPSLSIRRRAISAVGVGSSWTKICR